MNWILLVVAVAVIGIAAFAFFASRRPDTFSLRRAIVVAAPPERIWPLLVDFHRWQEWSPWEGRDPQLQRDYGGAPSGKGAVYAWKGNREVGRGRMEIEGEQPPRRLDIRLDFFEPFEAHNRAAFTLTPGPQGTTVDWEMTGPANFMTKAMSMVGAMDRMVGRDFESGLARLKAAAESA